MSQKRPTFASGKQRDACGTSRGLPWSTTAGPIQRIWLHQQHWVSTIIWVLYGRHVAVTQNSSCYIIPKLGLAVQA